MRVRLHWTPSNLAKVAKHGLSRDEVKEALAGAVYWRRATGRIVVIGRTSSRYLFVVLEPSSARPGWQEVVTARLATKSEKQLFAHRRKGP